MRRIVWGIIGILVCILIEIPLYSQPPKAQPVVVKAVPLPAGPKKLIAVARFENKTNWSGQIDLGRGMAEQLITALINTGRFIVLERENIRGILDEQDFAASGRTTAEGGARIGRISRAQILIQGAITEFGIKGGEGGGIRIKGFTLGGSGKRAIVGVDIRIYDTTTGQIISSHACRGVAEASDAAVAYTESDFGFSFGGSKQTPLDIAVRAAINQAVQYIIADLDRIPWQGKIALVKDNKVYINAGRQAGIMAGDKFGVYRKGESIIDPDTGLELGAEMKKLGQIEVVRVEEKYAVATPVSGTGFQRGDIIKFE